MLKTVLSLTSLAFHNGQILIASAIEAGVFIVFLVGFYPFHRSDFESLQNMFGFMQLFSSNPAVLVFNLNHKKAYELLVDALIAEILRYHPVITYDRRFAVL